MATEPIDLEAARRERRPSYIDRSAIESSLQDLEYQVRNMTVGSVAAFGAIDVLAYEIQAHITAIRRALGSSMPTHGTEQEQP